jgi:hypothetical protein
MENLYHEDFGTLDLAQERRITEKMSFFTPEQRTAEEGKEIANGRRLDSRR